MEFKQAGCFYSAPCLCSYPLPVWILHQFLVSIYFRLRYGKQIVPLFEYPVLMMSPLPKLRTWIIRCCKNIHPIEWLTICFFTNQPPSGIKESVGFKMPVQPYVPCESNLASNSYFQLLQGRLPQ